MPKHAGISNTATGKPGRKRWSRNRLVDLLVGAGVDAGIVIGPDKLARRLEKEYPSVKGGPRDGR